MEENDMAITHCKHFVIRKKRYCKMTVKKGEEYCGEHMPSSRPDSDSTKLRVTCPLDPKHTCFASKLTKHLKICNARQDSTAPYILKGVNCGEFTQISAESTAITPQPLDNYTTGEIKSTIDKIIKLYDEIFKSDVQEKFLTHPLVEEEISKPMYGNKSKKHLHQTSSILGCLKECDLIQPDTTYIEFGAGKGQLSFWIAKAVEGKTNSKVLLVEKASLRHKMDNKLDKASGITSRIRADISDLVLRKVDALKDVKRIVGVTKHLCGEATDLALRCLKKYNDDGGTVAGVVMAFCCHHRCNWTPYTGKTFLKENNLNEVDFNIMRGIVSWSTCGTGFSRDRNGTIDKELYMNSLETLSERDKEIGLSRLEKDAVGRKCKIILNCGRMRYLEEFGFKCELRYYINSSVSLENLCVTAVKCS